MATATRQRRSPLGVFPNQAAPRLYDRIVEVLRVRHYSRRTEEAYINWIRRYVEFHQHQHPRQLAEDDVNRFLTHLAVKEHVAASTQNQALWRSSFSTSMSWNSRLTASKASFVHVAPSGYRWS